MRILGKSVFEIKKIINRKKDKHVIDQKDCLC
jgi:hypothetical protein